MSKTVVITSCSANHLAQAKGLVESVARYNPGYKIIIGLVDKLEARVDPGYWRPVDIVEAHELAIPEFEKMISQYDVFELNCALKAFFADHAIKKYGADKLIFLDSDMLVFDSLAYIENELDKHSILITPHILSPFPFDGKRPFEREMLKNGIYNAGFFALKNDAEGQKFLDWWKARMVDQCYVNLKEGMFVDQKWLNLVPVFFPSTKWLDHPGCNMAYWNLHERKLSKNGERFIVNGQSLLFFHYSGYSMEQPHLISRHQDRVSMEENPALKELFQLYQDTLVRNKHAEMLNLAYYYKGKKSIWTKLGFGK